MKFAGRGYKDRLINLGDEIWDRRLGIHTFGYHPGKGRQHEPDWQVHYTPSTYSRIFLAFDIIALNRNDVFVDLGAGLGRSVFAASYRGVMRAVGVDIVPSLIDRANSNLRGRRYSNIEFHCMNAAHYRFECGCTVLLMFHPFGGDVLAQVVKNLDCCKDGLRIVYINPVYGGVLDDVPWLERFASIPEEKAFLSVGRAHRHAITFWRAK